jgi:catechol 2,3-dioxygenase-like lactoylglutathione lyase family enzyme
MSIHMQAPLEIGICVRNVARASAFYESVLGFQRISEATLAPDRAERAGFGPVSFRMVRLQTNYGERIKLLQPDPAPVEPQDESAILGRPGIAYLTFVVSDVDAAYHRLVAAGVPVMGSSPTETRPGTRLLFFKDCEGNPLELVQYDDLASYRPDLRKS